MKTTWILFFIFAFLTPQNYFLSANEHQSFIKYMWIVWIVIAILEYYGNRCSPTVVQSKSNTDANENNSVVCLTDEQQSDILHKPTVSTLAILSLILTIVLAPVSIVVGIMALYKIKKSNGTVSGSGYAIAGIIISIIFIFVIFINIFWIK